MFEGPYGIAYFWAYANKYNFIYYSKFVKILYDKKKLIKIKFSLVETFKLT
jgi:hypothetical protein